LTKFCLFIEKYFCSKMFFLAIDFSPFSPNWFLRWNKKILLHQPVNICSAFSLGNSGLEITQFEKPSSSVPNGLRGCIAFFTGPNFYP
jgi:hypothetical protein